ncbi:MAG: hydrogenase maturation protease [Thaumarchaeota archaeon]|nr:hydrogenase maturation protease [Nitrososphaerota archaeon]
MMGNDDGWLLQLSEMLDGSKKVNLVGIGNPIKQDDAVGLRVVSELLRILGPSPGPTIQIHQPSMSPERVLSALASKGERIVIFDAVEAGRKAGAIICASLNDTKFGFFATHNIPLRLIPGLAERTSDTFVVGIQSGLVDVGESLSDPVESSSKRLIAAVAGIARKAK